MKKKGFTLVELIAVMSIMCVILIAIFGIYITGIKRAETTKINADIENEYRNFYQVIKNSIKEDRDYIKLFYDDNTSRGWILSDLDKENNNFNNEFKNSRYELKEAYLVIKNKKSNIDNILISFEKEGVRTFYMIQVNSKDVEYKLDPDNILNGSVNIIGNIVSYRKICDNVTKFNVNENKGTYYFYLQYTKKGISREYNFSVNKSNERIIEININ